MFLSQRITHTPAEVREDQTFFYFCLFTSFLTPLSYLLSYSIFSRYILSVIDFSYPFILSSFLLFIHHCLVLCISPVDLMALLELKLHFQTSICGDNHMLKGRHAHAYLCTYCSLSFCLSFIFFFLNLFILLSLYTS